MKTSTIPTPGETRALMTGSGACEEDIEANGCARMNRVARGMTPAQRKMANPSFKGACDQADADDRYRASIMPTVVGGTGY